MCPCQLLLLPPWQQRQQQQAPSGATPGCLATGRSACLHLLLLHPLDRHFQHLIHSHLHCHHHHHQQQDDARSHLESHSIAGDGLLEQHHFLLQPSPALAQPGQPCCWPAAAAAAVVAGCCHRCCALP
jgi:hypothetical protein